PSLGPIYVEPSTFANLPATGVTHLQDVLLDQRLEFLRDPATGTAQSVGAFSSLHVSIFFTAVLAAHVLGLDRRVKAGAWILLGLTAAATVYFGWHYVLDDVGGLIIGVMALVLARALTGFSLRAAR
ncbi:MAG: phosphatase PAP2 family protein, partial [Actinomycetota bacterium]|nr:phosphatase PAP2 family protein [Actinomycetota bacterium]